VHESKRRGKQKPSSPKPREIDDILQLASFKAKCTTETECRFQGNCCLKLPLAESCLRRAKKSIGSKVAFPVSRTKQNSRSDEAIETFGLGTNIVVPVWWTNVGFPWFGNRYVEVWGVSQRSSCLRGMTVVACRDVGFPKRCQRGSLVVVWVLF